MPMYLVGAPLEVGVDIVDSIVRINVSDNEGLYDYQDIIIRCERP